MHGDRYLKIILTVIAIQLAWLGVRDLAPPVAAQPAVTPVVIRGIELPDDTPGLPVTIAGTRGALQVQPVGVVIVEAARPIKVEADEPLRVEMEQPIRVESVPYAPAQRPGE
jgi:hypothetical protein